MSRLNSPDGYVREVDIKTQRGTTRIRADRDGRFTNLSPTQEKALKSEGFKEAAISTYTPGDRERGYTCTQCGFGSWFRKCSRCGHEATNTPRDGDIDGDSGTN